MDSHLLSPPSLLSAQTSSSMHAAPTSWSAGVLQSSAQLHSSLFPMSSSLQSSASIIAPFSSSSLLSNQDALSYRSVTVAPPRNMHATHDNAWMQDSTVVDNVSSFDSWGSTHKSSSQSPPTAASSYFSTNTAAHKELSLAPLQLQAKLTPTTSTAASSHLTLPALPSFVEFSSFSVPNHAIQVDELWMRLQDHLLAEGIIVADTKDKQYQLLCYSGIGGKSTEFVVRCYSGHFREADSTANSVQSSCYTIEFQRRMGCCVGFIEIFRSVLRALSESNGQVLPIDSRIASEENYCAMIGACPSSSSSSSTTLESEGDEAQIEHVDLSDCDLSQLAIPSLAASRANTGIDDSSAAFSSSNTNNTNTAMNATLTADDSLYESLMDLICSADGATQLEGLNALSLCLDTSQPRAAQVLSEVASKLRTGKCERIKQAAARVILQAAASPQTASTVIQACLPAVLAQLAQCSAAVSSNGAPYPTAVNCPLMGACATQTQKCLLRSCLQLAACPMFQGALDEEGSAVAYSTLKRQLLRMTDSADEEVRGLAKQTIRALSV